MKEGELRAGDVLNKTWVIDEALAGGRDEEHRCIYACHHKDQPNKKYALKMREPHFENYFKHEVEALKKLNKAGGHSSFQKLIYSHPDPQKLYMVLDPLMQPSRAFSKIRREELMDIDPLQFIGQLFDALKFAARSGLKQLALQPAHLLKTGTIKPIT